MSSTPVPDVDPVDPVVSGRASLEPGHPVVADVLAELDALADLQVSEHVAVFESAHARLRGALADANGPSTPGA